MIESRGKSSFQGGLIMIRFNNDYNHGAHPNILEALVRTNDT